jgi:hypothetical protein
MSSQWQQRQEIAKGILKKLLQRILAQGSPLLTTVTTLCEECSIPINYINGTMFGEFETRDNALSSPLLPRAHAYWTSQTPVIAVKKSVSVSLSGQLKFLFRDMQIAHELFHILRWCTNNFPDALSTATADEEARATAFANFLILPPDSLLPNLCCFPLIDLVHATRLPPGIIFILLFNWCPELYACCISTDPNNEITSLIAQIDKATLEGNVASPGLNKGTSVHVPPTRSKYGTGLILFSNGAIQSLSAPSPYKSRQFAKSVFGYNPKREPPGGIRVGQITDDLSLISFPTDQRIDASGNARYSIIMLDPEQALLNQWLHTGVLLDSQWIYDIVRDEYKNTLLPFPVGIHLLSCCERIANLLDVGLTALPTQKKLVVGSRDLRKVFFEVDLPCYI